jgi:succinate dehydrogenase / fumarate reductase cytochrome b subunit
MNRFSSLYKNTIGKKFIAALTGLVLFGFLIGHVAGNLKVFTGASGNGVPHIDEYAQFLKVMGEPILPEMAGLWIARTILLVSLILHVVVVSQLALQSAEARPVSYVKSKKAAASLPALWMMFSGILILGFIIFHILHFTIGVIPLGDFEHGYVYNNLANSFALWPVAIGYVLVMVVLGFHLFHGIWSLFQTLGFDNPDRNRALRAFALVATIALVVGFSAVPVAFVLGNLINMPEPIEYVHSLLTSH